MRSLPDLKPLFEVEDVEGYKAFWRLDDRYIAVQKSQKSGDSSLFIVDTQTGDIQNQVFPGSSFTLYTMNPQNNYVLLSGKGGVVLMDVFGDTSIIRKFPLTLVASYSPTGEYLAIAHNYTEIEILETENYSQVQTITVPNL